MQSPELKKRIRPGLKRGPPRRIHIGALAETHKRQNAIINAQNAIPKAPHAAKRNPQCISGSKTQSPDSKNAIPLGIEPRAFRFHRIRTDSPKSDALIHCATGPIDVYGSMPKFALYIPCSNDNLVCTEDLWMASYSP